MGFQPAGPSSASDTPGIRAHLTETLSVDYLSLMNATTAQAPAKIIGRFMAALMETSTIGEALAVTEAAVIADLRALGSEVPDHGIRFLVRQTVSSAL